MSTQVPIRGLKFTLNQIFELAVRVKTGCAVAKAASTLHSGGLGADAARAVYALDLGNASYIAGGIEMYHQAIDGMNLRWEPFILGPGPMRGYRQLLVPGQTMTAPGGGLVYFEMEGTGASRVFPHGGGLVFRATDVVSRASAGFYRFADTAVWWRWDPTVMVSLGGGYFEAVGFDPALFADQR